MFVHMLTAIVGAAQEVPCIDGISCGPGGVRGIERVAKVHPDPAFRKVQTDGLERGLAGITNTIEAAGLTLIPGPREHTAAIELPIARMEAPAHDTGRKLRDRQRTHAALGLAVHGL